MISFKIILINVLQLVSVVQSETIQHEFRVNKTQDVNKTICESSLISSVSKLTGLVCLAACNSNQNCLTAVYDNSSGIIRNCFMYNRHFNTTEFIPSSTSTVYQKKSSKFQLKNSLYKIFIILLTFK